MTAHEREALVKKLQDALQYPIKFDPNGWTAKTCGLVQEAIEALSDAPAVTVTEGDIAAWMLKNGDINSLQRDDIWKLHDLIKHGAKIIDVRVRKDAREYTFEADWLKYLLRHVLGMADASDRTTTPQTGSQE